MKRPDCAPAKPKGSAVSFVGDVHRPTVCGLQYLSGLQRSKHRPHAVLQSIVCYSGGLGHCHGAGPRNLAQHILQQPRTVPVRGSQKFAWAGSILLRGHMSIAANGHMPCAKEQGIMPASEVLWVCHALQLPSDRLSGGKQNTQSKVP